MALLDYSGHPPPFAAHGSASPRLDYRRPFGAGTIDLQANANDRSHVFFDV